MDTNQQGTQQQPAAQGAQAAGQQQAPEPQMVNMTQAQFDATMQQRLERQQRQINAQYQQQFQQLGISGFDELQSRIDAEREAALEEERQRVAAMEQAGQTEELLRHERQRIAEMERTHSARIQELEQQLQQFQQQARQQAIQNTLLGAATEANAIAPSQVAQLVAPFIRHDDEGNAYVVDASGERRTNGQGQALTTTELVAEFIEQNPHFARPAQGRGANGQAPAGGTLLQQVDGLDPTKINDQEYLIANVDKLKAAATKGQFG